MQSIYTTVDFLELIWGFFFRLKSQFVVYSCTTLQVDCKISGGSGPIFDPRQLQMLWHDLVIGWTNRSDRRRVSYRALRSQRSGCCPAASPAPAGSSCCARGSPCRDVKVGILSRKEDKSHITASRGYRMPDKFARRGDKSGTCQVVSVVTEKRRVSREAHPASCGGYTRGFTARCRSSALHGQHNTNK